MTETKEKTFPKNRILSAGKFTEVYEESCRNGQRYCFILGSGASVESGIPMGSTLEYRWMNCLMGEDSDRGTPPKDRAETLECAKNLSDELQYDFSEIAGEWEKAREQGRNTLPSEYYFDIYKLRFYGDEVNGDRYFESIMESAEPSFGYHTLAQLLTDGNNNNLVITTNFDTLVEDALFIYTGKKPLIINHEFEAGFIREQSIHRPIIAKLHRGIFFKPFNNPADTTGLSGEWENILRQIFYMYIPVVIGYGGGDRSFMEFLLREQSLIPKMYWCYVNKYGLPDERIRDLIEKKRDGYFVRTDGFDHIMLTMGRNLFFYKISTNATEGYLKKCTDERISHYNEQYQKLSETKAGSDELRTEMKEFTKDEKKDREERKKSTSLTEWDYIREGNAYSDNNEYEKALKAYEKAREINSRQEGAYLGCGNMYLKMGEYEKALTAYNKALEVNPEYAYAYNGRGNTYQAIGEYEKALADYTRAQELDPEYGYAYYGRGRAYKAMGEYEKAVSDYDRALELDPEYVDAYNGRGNAYTAMGEYDKALIDYNKALELNPKYEHVYNNRGNMYGALGKYGKAIADYNQAIKINPGDALYYRNRANAYRKLGDAEKAEANEQKAKELEQK